MMCFSFLRAYAKLNLNLCVSSIQANKLHKISSIFQSISFFDDLYIKPTCQKRLRLFCNHSDYPLGPSNLLMKVYAYYQSQLNCGFDIYVQKHVPIGAGLGGGSSQVAAFMLYLNQTFKLGQSLTRLIQVASEFGSDVPFFLQGGTCLVSGYGDQIKSISDCFNQVAYLLVLPKFSLLTADVYRHFDTIVSHANRHVFEDAVDVPLGHNDLLDPVFSLCPDLKKVLSLCHSLTEQAVYMSGSGSTLFIPFNDREDLCKAYIKLQGNTDMFTLYAAFSVSHASSLFD
eukprot:COSAG01_NODE_4_length_55812_cov_1344.168109_42_plen_286_part_00